MTDLKSGEQAELQKSEKVISEADKALATAETQAKEGLARIDAMLQKNTSALAAVETATNAADQNLNTAEAEAVAEIDKSLVESLADQ